MSGCGRKGAYRKGVTDDVLHGNPVPEEGELVAQVKGSRGGNVIDVHCGDDTEGIAVMPQKFRKLIWVKRGDFVIVSGASEDIENNNGSAGAIRYRVKHILYKDQIRHIKSVGLWPAIFSGADMSSNPNAAEVQDDARGMDKLTISNTNDEDTTTSTTNMNDSSSLKKNKVEITNDYSDESETDEEDVFVNPNHRKVVEIPSSDEED